MAELRQAREVPHDCQIPKPMPKSWQCPQCGRYWRRISSVGAAREQFGE
jgi:hypothetical protein